MSARAKWKSLHTSLPADAPAPHSPQAPTTTAAAAGTPTAVPYSCVACKQRKVKCSRQFPCAECVRMDVECVPSSRKPYSSRKRRRGQSDDNDEDESPERPQPQVTRAPSAFHEPRATETPASEDQPAPAPIAGSGNTPLPDPSTGFISGLGSNGSSIVSLKDAHPQPVHAFILWQTYLQSVNPLSKIIYAPQVQDLVIQAVGGYDSLSTANVALLFAIYAAAVSAMSEADCQAKIGEGKQHLLQKYLTCAQQALGAAEFMRSTNLNILQAFTIFLLAARQSYDADAMWILTGMAVRMGQRLLATVPAQTANATTNINGNSKTVAPQGKNKGKNAATPSFFDTQMRLRVWWQILLLDGRVAQLSGQARVLPNELPDLSLPANLNDSDINPNMTGAPPPITDRPTEMIFCLLRYEMGKLLFSKGSVLHDPKSTIAERDAIIDDLTTYFKEKFLGLLDPAIPLHQIAEAGAHAAVDKMRLMAHHPGQYPDKGKSMPQAEHDMLFKTSVNMVDTLVQGFTATHLEHFKWHIDVYFQLDAVVFMLIESQSQPPEGELVDKAWRLVAEVLHYKRHLVQDQDELGRAVRQLVLRAWESRERRARKEKPGAALPTPPATVAELLAEMRQRRRGQRQQHQQQRVIGGATNNDGSEDDGEADGEAEADGEGTAVLETSRSSTAVDSTAVVPSMDDALSVLAPPLDFQYPATGSSSLDASPFSSYNDMDVLGWETTDWDSWSYWNQLLQGQT
ncbi:hypothetical protein Sste5344_002715 [Sporothrix stenoceras]